MGNRHRIGLSKWLRFLVEFTSIPYLIRLPMRQIVFRALTGWRSTNWVRTLRWRSRRRTVRSLQTIRPA